MKQILTLCLFFSTATLAAQTLYTRTDTIAITQDSVTLKAGTFRGAIQWQRSEEGETWEDLSGKTTGELKIAGTATGYYRAEITDGTCFPVYSDTAFIEAAADTNPYLLYMCGTATGGWNFNVSVGMLKTSPDVYYTIAYFLNGGIFRFFATKASDAIQYNYTYFTTVDWDLDNANDGEKNFRVAGATGYYAITVNMKSKTIVMEPVEEPTMYLFGGAVGGWAWGTNNVKMAWKCYGMYEATTTFSNDIFGFYYDQGWSAAQYNSFPTGNISSLLEANPGNNDNNFRFIGTPGTYKVFLNLVDLIIEISDATEVQSPAVPTPPGDSRFDSVFTDETADNAVEQDQDGTSGADKIVQYGGTTTTAQYAYGNDGNDWILQQGGNNTTIQQVSTDMGNDTVYQFAGSTGTVQSISGADGAQTLVQVGGDGTDTMRIQKAYATGNSTIQQYSGAGNDAITGCGGADNDTIVMYGQSGNDTMTFYATAGTDTVTIDGGSDIDSVTINEISGSVITVKDSSGNVLYTSGSGGKTITVLNAESIIVKNADGDVVYQR